MSLARLLPAWLREAENHARSGARRAHESLAAMVNKDTPYAAAIRAIGEAHSEAAEVYRRRLAALIEGGK